MLLNTFNVQNLIEKEVGGFDDSIYIVTYTLDKVVLHVTSCFDWETLVDEVLPAEFPQADFNATKIGNDVNIWWE